MIERSAGEIASILVKGGQDVCDHAISKWWSGDYGKAAKQQERCVKEWQEIRQLFGSCRKDIKEVIKQRIMKGQDNARV